MWGPNFTKWIFRPAGHRSCSRLPSGIGQAIVEPDGKIFYDDGNSHELYDPSTGQSTNVGAIPNHSFYRALSPDGSTIYGTEANGLYRMDLNGDQTLVKTYGVSGQLTMTGLTFDDSGNLWADYQDIGSNAVAVVELDPTTGSILETINVSTLGQAGGLTWDSATKDLYLTEATADTVYLRQIDPATMSTEPVVESLSGGASGIVADGQGDVYFSNNTEMSVVNFVGDGVWDGESDNIAPGRSYTLLSPLVGPGSLESVTPEPSRLLLAGIGSAALLLFRRRRAA